MRGGTVAPGRDGWMGPKSPKWGGKGADACKWRGRKERTLVLVLVLVLVIVIVIVAVVVVVVVVVAVAATDHRRQCSCANLARGANSKGSQQAPFAKRKGCPIA